MKKNVRFCDAYDLFNRFIGYTISNFQYSTKFKICSSYDDTTYVCIQCEISDLYEDLLSESIIVSDNEFESLLNDVYSMKSTDNAVMYFIRNKASGKRDVYIKWRRELDNLDNEEVISKYCSEDSIKLFNSMVYEFMSKAKFINNDIYKIRDKIEGGKFKITFKNVLNFFNEFDNFTISDDRISFNMYNADNIIGTYGIRAELFYYRPNTYHNYIIEDENNLIPNILYKSLLIEYEKESNKVCVESRKLDNGCVESLPETIIKRYSSNSDINNAHLPFFVYNLMKRSIMSLSDEEYLSEYFNNDNLLFGNYKASKRIDEIKEKLNNIDSKLESLIKLVD